MKKQGYGKSNDFETDHGNEWSKPVSDVQDFNDPGSNLFNDDDDAVNQELADRREQSAPMTAPHYSGDPTDMETVEQDFTQRQDSGRKGLINNSDQLYDDAAEIIHAFQLKLVKAAYVNETRYLYTTVTRRGHTGHIIEGSMSWKFVLQKPASNKKRSIVVAFPIRQGSFENPSVFADAQGKIYPLTEQGLEKFFGPEVHHIVPDTAIGIAWNQ